MDLKLLTKCGQFTKYNGNQNAREMLEVICIEDLGKG